jgi:hypothetical protein
MTTDIKDSIKARLYDVKYTPFMASYLFAWIFLNAKSILIFFTDKLSISEKIEMLSYSSLDYLVPLYFGLFYTIIFPLISAMLYYITLQYKRLMNYIKQQIQDKTPLTQEEANKILKINLELEIELNSKIVEIGKIKSNFETKIKDLASKEIMLETRFNAELMEKTKSLSDTNNKLLDDIKAKDKTIQEQSEKIVTLDNKPKSTKNNNLTDDELKLLKVIYDNNINEMQDYNYVNEIISKSDFKEIKIQALINSLIEKNIIAKRENDFGTYYNISSSGRKIILEEFDN